jgi:hypothetical protein
MKYRRKVASILMAAAIAWLGATTTARAGPITFDPDGGGPLAAIPNANTFDFLPGNSLGLGYNTAFLNFLNGTGSTVFSTLFQARLGSITNAAGQDVTPAGQNTAFQHTVVARFNQQMISAIQLPVTTTSVFCPTGPNFVEIYLDSNVDANDLFGVGFNDTTDGPTVFPAPPPPVGPPSATTAVASTLIASAVVTSATSFFAGVLTPSPVPLDAFGGVNNYPGQQTGSGVGTATLTADLTFVNPAFFPTLAAGSTITFAISQGIFFDQADPSSRFIFGPGGTGVGANPTIAGAGIGAASLGTVNGNLFGPPPGGPDVQFQTDINQTFQPVQAVPEPSAVLLCVLGSSGLGLARFIRNRRRSVKV